MRANVATLLVLPLAERPAPLRGQTAPAGPPAGTANRSKSLRPLQQTFSYDEAYVTEAITADTSRNDLLKIAVAGVVSGAVLSLREPLDGSRFRSRG